MIIYNFETGKEGEKFPVYSFMISFPDRSSAKVVVVDRPTKRIVCIPVSYGCARSCLFCSSASQPLRRQFSAYELQKITKGVIEHQYLPSTKNPILVSLMGVGEPLDNKDVPEFLRDIRGYCKTALATTVPNLDDLNNLMLKCPETKILISLHAGMHTTRRRVLGDERAISPSVLYKFFGDSVEYNYVTLEGVNDHTQEAFALNNISSLGKMRLKLNTLNHWPGMSYVEGNFPFQMLNRNIEVEFYSTDGASVFGACGQCGYRW